MSKVNNVLTRQPNIHKGRLVKSCVVITELVMSPNNGILEPGRHVGRE